MKTIRLIVLAALLLPALVSQAQTKEETIAWLKEKLEKYSIFNRPAWAFSELKLLSITECEITYTYNYFKERQVKIALPTTGMVFYKAEKGVWWEYKSKVVRYENLIKNGDISYSNLEMDIGVENREENIYERIQKAIAHLATFCPKKTEAF